MALSTFNKRFNIYSPRWKVACHSQHLKSDNRGVIRGTSLISSLNLDLAFGIANTLGRVEYWL